MPQLPAYGLVALGSETISSASIPAVLTSGVSNIALFTGDSSVLVNARTASFSGTFFGSTKTDGDIRGSSVFYVYIDLVHESWALDVASDLLKRQALITALFSSTRKVVDAGYEHAFEHQVRARVYAPAGFMAAKAREC